MDNFLTPVLALILWTLIMLVVMYIRRIPAMNAITKDTQRFIDEPDLKDQIPAKARWAADNHNHLHEQPVIFYALMFYLFLTQTPPSWIWYLAWTYVGIRIVHSLVQITQNKVLIRFSLFIFGTVILMVMGMYAAGYAVGFSVGQNLG